MLRRRTKFPPKRKAKALKLLLCSQCTNFSLSKVYMMGDRIVRECRVTKKTVDTRTEACEHFVPARWIHCPIAQDTVTPEMCLDRQRKRRNGCSQSCRPGKGLRILLER